MNKILEGFRYILKDIRVVIALLPAMIGRRLSWEGHCVLRPWWWRGLIS